MSSLPIDRIRVIVAEDMAILREDYCDIIQAAEDLALVGAVGSAAACRQLLKEKSCDVLLLDVEMETIDAGPRLAREVHGLYPDMKIVFLSAHAGDEFIMDGLDSGASDYIVKGCSDEDLLRHIRQAYAGETQMQPQVQQSMRRAYTRLKKSEQSLLFFIHNVSLLTPAERNLLALLLEGKKLKEIAAIRYVEQSTIKSQVKSLLRKFDCSRTREIVDLIHELGLEHLFQDA